MQCCDYRWLFLPPFIVTIWLRLNWELIKTWLRQRYRHVLISIFYISSLRVEQDDNLEVYQFLASAASKYGVGFWQPGGGIIHQVTYSCHTYTLTCCMSDIDICVLEQYSHRHTRLEINPDLMWFGSNRIQLDGSCPRSLLYKHWNYRSARIELCDNHVTFTWLWMITSNERLVSSKLAPDACSYDETVITMASWIQPKPRWSRSDPDGHKPY